MMKDWCSSWPDKYKDIDYSLCCKKHDEDYEKIRKMRWWKRPLARFKSNIKLGKCVRSKGLPKMGVTMMVGTQLFGWPSIYFKGKKDAKRRT